MKTPGKQARKAIIAAITFIMDGKLVRPVDKAVTRPVIKRVPMYDWKASEALGRLAENRE